MLVSLELTDGCNFNCEHCFKTLNSDARFLDPGLIRKLLPQLDVFGEPCTVALTGGEPTMHTQLETIISDIEAHGHRYSMVTNGWSFDRVRTMIADRRESLEAITFSLDGSDEGTHDRIRRAGSFRRVISGLAWCQANHLTTMVNFVVTRENHDELHDVVRIATTFGCRALGLAHCKPAPDAIRRGLVMNLRERRRLEADIGDLQELYRLPIYLAGDRFASEPPWSCPQLELRVLHIDVRGRLTACCELSAFRGGAEDTEVVADLRNTSLADALDRLAERSSGIIAAKESAHRSGRGSDVDQFLCSRCLLDNRKIEQHCLQEAMVRE